jgi:tetratricopeptide (TPR) repeat protein
MPVNQINLNAMNTKTKVLMYFALLAPFTLQAQQLVTMSNKCFKLVQAGNKQNDQGDHANALTTFTKVLKDCSTKDAREEGNIGLAIASNGLRQYDQAITAANNAIKASKQTSVMAYYARSHAYGNLGRTADAKADIIKINELTRKNKNLQGRAKMYAQLAHLNFQLDMLAEADTNLTKAIELDPGNPAFFIQKGDMMFKVNNYEEAFVAYDKVLELGKNDLETTAAEIRDHRYH